VRESFLRAWERLQQLDDPDAFPGWFRRIVRRVAIDAVTRDDEAALSPQAEAALPGASAGPVEELPSRESTDEVRTAMEALPETSRTSVVLYYVDGYSQQQVADFRGISVVAVKKRIQRGRDQMRENLEDRIRQTVGRLKPSNDGRLLENVNIYTNFSIAAQLGQMSLLEAMLVDGIDVNEPDATGRPLLHWADQHLRDHDGKSPRDIAQTSRAGQAILRILNEYR
jgi:RNA polymerase sigma factor (sigma-70 family)